MKSPNPSRRRFLLQTTGSAALLSSTPVMAQRSSSSAKVKFAQIGTKHSHAAGKLSAVRDLEDLYEVVGVAEPDAAQQERVASRSPYKHCAWASTDDLLANPEITVIGVETAIDDLVPTAIRCLKAGKHIHLDKPAGQTLSACREMHAEATKRGLTIQMGYMLRYNPAFEFLFRAVKEGWLGDIREVHGHMGKKASRGLRQELAQYPGGGLFELACHLIDAVVTVLGKPEEVIGVNLHTQDDGFLDNQLAIFRYPSALATVGSNHVDPFGGPRRQFSVIGEKGTLEIRPLEPPNLTLKLTEAHGDYDTGVHQIELPKAEGRYHGEFRDLAKIARGEKKLAWDAVHDVAVQETLLRASGMPIDT